MLLVNPHSPCFFLQGISTTGVLLLLTFHGPGHIAVQEQEELLLLPTQDAKD